MKAKRKGVFSKQGISDMAEKAKGKKTNKNGKPKIRVPNRPSEDIEAEAGAEAEAEVEAEAKAEAKAKSSSEPGTEDVEVEDLVDGVVAVIGTGLGTVVDKFATVGAGLLSDAQSASRSAVSAAMGGIVKVCRIVDDAVGVKDPGFQDKG